MKVSCFLTFTQRGAVKATKNYPALGSGEFAVKLRLEVPDEFFKPEVPVVDLTIHSRDVIMPVVVIDGEQVPQPEADPKP